MQPRSDVALHGAPDGRKPGPHDALQGVQLAAPDVLANDTPAWHGVHAVWPGADEVPIGQLLQVVSAMLVHAAVVYFPLGQIVHVAQGQLVWVVPAPE